ncbi:MAG: lysylphosphatidylglycerol synthase transmembrane domain-containing protein [Candidatus Cloacimonadales bacterium]|nr:lysylphosphatidylglycerol synthase transmembrane domain-containing protein [Candidatus Cloacimonadales bacterium]
MKKRILYVVQFIITVALFYIIVHRFQFTLDGLTLKFQKPVWLVFSLYFSIILIPILAAARWNVFLGYTGIHATFNELLKINFESIFWGTFLPSSDGFAAIRLYKIERKYAEVPGKAGSTVVAEKLLGFIVLCLFALIFSFKLIFIPSIFLFRLIILLILLILIVSMLVIFQKTFYDSISNFLLKSQLSAKIAIFISNLYDSLVKLPKLKMMVSAVPLIISIQLCTFINVYLLFKIVGIEIPISYHLAIVPVIQIISLIPLTLSGLGIREGAFVYFYGFLGVKPEIAFAVSLLNFLILNGIPAVIGGIISITTQLQKRGISR